MKTTFLSFTAMTLLSMSAHADDAACIAATEQALTLRQSGKLHSALVELATCANPACPGEVKEECARRIVDINAVMPLLVFAAKDGAGNDLDAVTVTMDGAPLATKLDGRPISIDPGEHVFRFEVSGQPPVEKKLVLREGDRDRRETITLGPTSIVHDSTPSSSSSWNAQKALALVSGGLGLVGIGLGATFGAFAISSQNEQHSDCNSSTCAHYLQSLTDYDYSNRNATASTVSFIAGGVLAATGIVLWLTAPKRVRIAPLASPQAAGLILRGEF